MSETRIDQALIDAVVHSRDAVMGPQVILTSGNGKAYQAVAQSAAIAIQDAADSLRNISTVATTAAGVALAQYLATGDDKYKEILNATQTVMTSATTDFTNIGTAAVGILKSFKDI
jgi:hypothetical protein